MKLNDVVHTCWFCFTDSEDTKSMIADSHDATKGERRKKTGNVSEWCCLFVVLS